VHASTATKLLALGVVALLPAFAAAQTVSVDAAPDSAPDATPVAAPEEAPETAGARGPGEAPETPGASGPGEAPGAGSSPARRDSAVGSAAALVAGLAPAHRVETFRLPNGLEVVLEPDVTHPRVAVAVTYDAGLRVPPASAPALARLAERLMLEGSRNVAAGEHVRILERAGATAVGSFLGHDGATYFAEVPAHHLATALWLEADRMASVLARVDGAALARARRATAAALVAERERSAAASLDALVDAALYPRGHPYRVPDVGPRDLRGPTIDHARWFFQRRYAPHAARLAIVGDFEATPARALVERYFATIRASAPPPPRSRRTPAPTLDAEHRIVFGALLSAQFVRIVWPTAPYLRNGDAELDLVAHVLGQGRRSRLHRVLVERDGVASSVWAWQGSRELASTFTVQVEVADGRTAAEVVDGVDDAIRRLCAAGPSAAELERATWQNAARELAGAAGLVERANAASRIRSPLRGDGVYRVADDVARYVGATAGAVREAACRALPAGRRVVAVVVPDEGAPRTGRPLSYEVRR
jgi:zinc protease